MPTPQAPIVSGFGASTTADSPQMHGIRPRATDPVAPGRLWKLSEQLTVATID